MSTKVRVVIPVKNNVDYTKGCLESLFNSVSDDMMLQVIIVDNGSTDGTPAYLKSLEDRITCIRNEDNKGFAGAVNQGLRYQPQDFDYALVLNNDTVVPRGLVDRMVHCFTLQQDIGIVGPMSNFAGGHQGINDKYELETLDEFAEKLYSDRAQLTDVGVVVGLCMMIRKKVIDEVGYFDDIAFKIGSWEDNDYCLRSRNAGWKCVVNPGLFIHHYGSKTFNSLGINSSRMNFLVNKQKFFTKWTGIYKTGKKKKIVGMLRVKNGEPYVSECLSMASRFCDELVILVGSDSTDNTWNICKKFDKVALLEKSLPGYNESKDRNRLLEMVKARSADWVYCLDHDEIPEEKLVKKIQVLCNHPDPTIDGWIFKICNFWSQDDNSTTKIRTDGLWGNFYQCRLFRLRRKDYIKDCEIHCGSHPTISSENFGYSYIRIKHYGNMLQSERARKYKFYTEVDKNKDVSMILGGWYNHYCKVYGKDKLEDSDMYRHVVDETNIHLQEWVEDNSVSLCMISGNEKTWFQRLLKNTNLKLLCSEIVVVDNGSTDGTRQYLLQHGVRVVDGKKEWLNEKGRLMDYSSARNLSLAEAKGRWILQLDPDENIPMEHFNSLFELLQKDVDAYLFPIKNIQNLQTNEWALSETCRLFKNNPYIYYSGLIHEDIRQSLDEMVRHIKPAVVERAPFELLHFGYLRDDTERKQKYDHYADLCKRQIDANPSDFKLLFSLAVHYYHIGEKGKSLSYYLKSIKANSEWYMAYNDVGILWLQRGNIDKAERYLKRAVELVNKDTSAHKLYRDKVHTNYRNCIEYKKALYKEFTMCG